MKILEKSTEGMQRENMRKKINIKEFLTDQEVVTSDIQRAIDSLGEEGGILFFPGGTYVTGTFFLRSNVTLYLDCGAEIAGSGNLEDYREDHEGAIEAPGFSHCLIYAEHAENIEIMGNGTIDGYGAAHSAHKGGRPMLMRFVDCMNVRFEKVHLRNAGSWGVHMVECSDIHIHQVDLDSRVQPNNDGFDFDSCRNIFISNSKIFSSDDSICLKSTKRTMGENLVVTNCVLSSHTAVFKIGSSSLSGFKNVTIQNCVIRDCPMGTFKIMSVDGGLVENINISNIVMDQVGSPLFIRVGKRNLKFEAPAEMDYDTAGQVNEDAPGQIRNVMLSNIQANVTVTDKSRTPIMIAGLKDSKIENVRITNIRVSFFGGGTVEDREIVVPEDEYRYPEQWFFGVLPAYAVYARHVNGLRIEGAEFTLTGREEREAYYIEDVERLIVRE